MSWIIFSLLAALLWSIVNIVDKYTLTNLVETPLVPILLLGLVGIVATVIIFGVHGFIWLSYWNIFIAFLTGLLYVLTMFFYYHAVKREEISKVIPIYYLTPVFILFIATETLGEKIMPLQMGGIGLLVFGAILISAKTPFAIRMNSAIGLMLLADICYALNQVLTKYLLQFADFWTIYAYVRIGILITLVPIFFLKISECVQIYRSVGRYGYGVMSINQVLNLTGVLAITIAMSSGYVTLVNGLASVQPFFVFIFAVALSHIFPHILQEKISRSILIMKLIAIGLMFTGALLVS